MAFGDFWFWSVTLLLGGGDGGRTAVHVELAITDLVDPRPGDRILPWGNAIRNRILKDGGT